MVSITLINRLVATSRDFDASGLDVISYYLRFYAVEEILSDESRPGEITELATELLNSVEEYKNSVEASNEDDESNATYILIHDQEKAKVYLSNFAMSLYNGKLEQVQKGPWDVNLRRGLWCCIDLFSCIVHLWEDPNDSYKKRIKYCKLYLSKLAKGHLGKNTPESEQSGPDASKVSAIELSNYVESANKDIMHGTTLLSPKEGVEDRESTPVQLDYGDFMEREKDSEPSDGEISDMLHRLRAKEEDDEKPDFNNEEEGEKNPSFSLPEIPVELPSSVSPKEIPQFLDPEDEDDKEDKITVKKEEVKPPKAHTRQELNDMMDTSSKIEKVQRMAKYAISALNYEDIATARDELTNALEVLNSIK